ncbi:hypothetical protein [Burkholderia cepacia]|uniref:hypothetical protein n=1 Tax=Burkholderia cepacia TaxID=292 RepID=UPI001576BA50|nr:hypothetical protein [Burkholderia cepacia]NTX20486.1 hypothetical protein [Burkholderia cepacia]
MLVNSPVSGDGIPAAFQNNPYFTKGGASAARWIWNDATSTTRVAFQQASGSEAAGALADPVFIDVTTPDLHVASGSPAIGTGIDFGTWLEGIYDHVGLPRVVSGRVDRELCQVGTSRYFSDTRSDNRSFVKCLPGSLLASRRFGNASYLEIPHFFCEKSMVNILRTTQSPTRRCCINRGKGRSDHHVFDLRRYRRTAGERVPPCG